MRFLEVSVTVQLHGFTHEIINNLSAYQITLKLQCSILQKRQNNKYTANNAKNSICADKVLIIS